MLVTHQIQYLPLATRVLLLDREGRMVDCAPWDELKARVPDWHAFVEEEGNEEGGDVGNGVVDETALTKEGGAAGARVGDGNGNRNGNGGGSGNGSGNVATPVPTPLPTLNEQTRPRKPAGSHRSKNKEESTYILKEERASGGVAGATYLHYLKSGGTARGVAVAALMIVAQGALMASDFWLKIWAASGDQRRDFYPCVYAGLMGVVVVLGFARYVVLLRQEAGRAREIVDRRRED